MAQNKPSRPSGTKAAVTATKPAKQVEQPAVQTNDPVLLSVGGDEIGKSEFDRVFRKNNSKDSSYDEKSVREYLDLYINYKLKVKEAEA